MSQDLTPAATASLPGTPLETGAGPIRGATYVPSTPEHVLWGRLPCAADPFLERVDPGSEVTFDTVSHEGILEDQGRDPAAFFAAYDVEHVLADAVAIAATTTQTHPRTFGVDGPHVVSRPVEVSGARVGDLLAVTVLETLPRVPYGVISNRHGKGALPGEFPLEGEVFSAFASVDATGTRGQLPLVPGGERLVEFPLAPFLGIMGVAVAGAERPHSVPPGPHGGNIDINLLTVGSTLYLPVQVDGAGFYVGDPHFAQGDGEVALTAMEASLRATVRLDVVPHEDAVALFGDLAGPLARDLGPPRPDRPGPRPRHRDGQLRARRRRPAAGPVRDGPQPGPGLPQRRHRLRHLPGRRRGQGRARPDPRRGLRPGLPVTEDPRVWRLRGDPLVRGAADGPLVGEQVAVKDLYAVAGHAVGAGNPAWLEAAATEDAHAWAVGRLLDAGADVAGIARTDEFAYSLAGTNAHHGTPPNPRAPGRIPGGSSSGSATAVSLGEASIGLGTDTGGSVRVPAAYQGLWGIRTTHGAVPVEGLLPLAPSFDTVGWLTRDAALLRRVGEVLLPPRDAATGVSGGTDLVVVPGLLALATPEVAAATGGWARERDAVAEEWPLEELGAWLAAFQRLQAWEAWRSDGDWLAGRLDTLGADVRARFENASRVTEGQARESRAAVAAARSVVRDLVGDRVLALPSASSVAPETGPRQAEHLQAVRDATMRLTCLAGLGGLPAVSVPLATAAGLPCGVCLVAAPGRDLDLLTLAGDLSQT